MKPFTTVTATAAPLMRANIDTDQIIRIDRLVAFTRGELAPYCLEVMRFLPDGQPTIEREKRFVELLQTRVQSADVVEVAGQPSLEFGVGRVQFQQPFVDRPRLLVCR